MPELNGSSTWLAEHAHDYVLPDGFMLGVAPDRAAQAEEITQEWNQVLARMLRDYQCA